MGVLNEESSLVCAIWSLLPLIMVPSRFGPLGPFGQLQAGQPQAGHPAAEMRRKFDGPENVPRP